MSSVFAIHGTMCVLNNNNKRVDEERCLEIE